MSIPSNLYAEKAFAEHPIALWSLDDAADYISLLSESNRNVYEWTPENCSVEQVTSIIGEPFVDSSVTRISGNVITEDSGSFSCTSSDILDFSEINKDLGTFCIGAHIYSTSPYITSYEIGYEYYDVPLGEWIQKTKTFNITIMDKWMFLSNSFTVPNNEGSMRLFLKANFLGGYQDTSENSILVNGFTLGQWSEEFASTSLGVTPIEIPEGIFEETTYGYPARSYGLEENNGYYLVKDNSFVAKNSGAPMVYGTSNCTVLTPNDGKPSLIIPSMGFLNDTGKYRTYTVEMWMRINCDSTEPKKIFGSLEDESGLYAEGPFLVLRIGNKSASHYVGEWSRPMLIHILYLENSSKMYINGEEVLSITYQQKDLNFISKKKWLGFWSYDDISPIELDCVGIYPYKVSNIVAKRRLVFGQGVESPDNINTAYSGQSLLIDYAFADYTNNYSYPDIGRWNQGINDNLSSEKNILSTANYTLPSFLINNQEGNYADWLTANSNLPQEIDDEYFRVRPNSSYNGQIYFNNLNFLQQQVKSIYGVFKKTGANRSITEEVIVDDVLLTNFEDVLTVWFKMTIPDTILKYINENTILKVGVLYFKVENIQKNKVTFSVELDNLFTLIAFAYAVANQIPFPLTVEIPMTLFKIVDPNQNYFHVQIPTNSNKITYSVKFNNVLIENILYPQQNIFDDGPYIGYADSGINQVQIGEKFYAGFNIDNVVKWFGGPVASILGNISQCRLYIGNDQSGDTWFDGNIYKVALCNARNHSLIAPAFGEYGLPADYELYIAGNWNQEFWDRYADSEDYDQAFWDYIIDGGSPGGMLFDKILDHTASYTLVASRYFDDYQLDIDTMGYWEDYQPLTYYAQFVDDEDGDRSYDLDFLQFNINYPAPSKFYEIETPGEEWSYAELYNRYNYPRKRTYDSLDNFLFTGYRDYEDLQYNITRSYKYDTSNSLVRSYVSFQYIEAGASQNNKFFTKTEPAAKEGTVIPDSTWLTTKYEVIDNMIIYPPSGVDFNDLSLVTHLEFKVKNILRNKVKVKKLEYCSQSFNYYSNPIGTNPFVKMYPYKKSGIYYNYKGRNPYSIYKKTSPYLYMTRTSGVQLRGVHDPLINRGLMIPINENKTLDFDKIMAMQLALRFDEDYFPYAPTQIFEIEAKNAYIKFYIVANDQTGKRGKIYAVNSLTGRLENGIGFYLNGKIVRDPVLTIKQWAFLGISFSNLLDISGVLGSIKLNGPMLFNNISYYQSTNLQEVQKVSTRPWFQVKRSGPLTLDWEYWVPDFFLWNGVLVQSSISYYGVDPEDVYQSYVGTNKIITGTDKVLGIGQCEYNVYQQVSWQQTTSSAV